MGKASKWFRSLWSSKKSPESSPAKENNKKSRLSLSSSGGNSGKLKNHFEDPLANTYVEGIDAKMHAIAVAADTAAEAALAAAQAETEVVRLTEGDRSWRVALDASYDRQLVSAAVKIQSAFRAYLARRALRALKGLVKLQALVRGYIVRKQSADMLRCMQAMARIQAQASAHRSYYMPESPYAKTNLSNSHNPSNHSRSRTGISVYEETSHIASQWLNHWMEQCALEKTHHDTYLENDKILEIDTWKPHLDNKTRNGRSTPTPRFFSAWKETGADYTTKTGLPFELHKPNPSISSEDVLSVGDHVPALTAHNSTGVHSASCRPTGSLRGPSFTPSRSECSRSLLGDYRGHPSYMANTESSRAKVRCRSVPKQRMQLEEIGLSHDFWDYSDAIPGRCSFLAANDTGGTYRYSGKVKRQWTPRTRDVGVLRLRP